jgi:hypothetical protein
VRFLAFPITLFAAMLISVVPVSAQTVPARGAEPSSANHPVLVDGKREPSIIAALRTLGLTSHGHRFWYSSIEPGEVIRPGASAMILRRRYETSPAALARRMKGSR